ncbi:hypothetical protein DFH09DRAFT_1157167 [Mycena vulgaris]|nr:hypothetical protein DFH09DRAFT_1157167 [Mycena vulgaris]
MSRMAAVLQELVAALDVERAKITPPQLKAVRPASLSDDPPLANDIDCQIEWHLRQIAGLRGRKNDALPIARLPNELLCRIFSIYAADSPRYNRRWHDLVVAHHTLWGFIYIYKAGQTSTLLNQLHRSHEAPLTIEIGYLESRVYALVLLACATRWRNVDITAESSLLIDLFPYLSALDLPVLERLKLRPPPAPASVHMSLNCSSLRGLEELSLVSCVDTASAQIASFSSVLSAIQSCPRLQTLELEGVIGPFQAMDVHPTVDLPLLGSLTLREDADTCTHLLHHLTFPAAARISITSPGIHSGSDITPLLVPLRRHLRARGAPVLQLLHIQAPLLDEYTATTLKLAAYTETAAPDPSDLDVGAALHLLCLPLKERHIRQIATKVLHTLPAEHITYLDARFAAHLTPASWRMVLARLPSVHALYLSLTAVTANISSALRQMERSPRIRSVTFHMGWCGGDEMEVAFEARDALIELLTLWKEEGSALERLDLGMMYDKWEVLAGAVGTLTHNGLVYEREMGDFV